jgi:PAS domain S-box-containing protein
MIGDFEEIRRIRMLLAEKPTGMSITDISRELGIHRTTVARYLDALQMKGEVDLRKVSTAKMYHLSARIPSSALSVYTGDPYLLISYRMVIIASMNGIIETLGIHADPKGRTLIDPVLSPLMQEDIIKKIKEAIQGLRSSAELNLIVQGIKRWLTISVIPVVCEDGRPGCAIICRDDTPIQEALLKAELCAGESEALASDQTEFIFRSRPDGILTFVNEAFCRRIERKKEELVGFPYEPVISHEDLERLSRVRSTITPTNPTGKISFKAIQPDGLIAFEEWLFRGIFNNSGILFEYQAIGRDISEIKHLEEQLQTYHTNFEIVVKQRIRELRSANQDLMAEIARREKLERELLIIRFVFDQASDSILLFEKTGTLYRANETACKLLGYTKEEIQKISVFDVNPEISPELWQQMWMEAGGDDEASRVRSVHRRQNGEIISVEVSRKFITAGPISLLCSIARQIGSDPFKK